uniref:Ribosomal protein S11 n=1 Tax=Sebdenia flabellata TaxID=42024 RepID=A0A0E3DBU1_9FLOR|nr:ribosomal protein S11 [Sebdenia flabellata]
MNILHRSIIITILFTSSNILYSVTDLDGKVICWSSVGSKKIKGTKKITLPNLTLTSKLIINCIKNLGYNFLHIRLKGFKKNKKTILKYFKTSTLNILSICDNTPLPHNGCKKRKVRRI